MSNIQIVFKMCLVLINNMCDEKVWEKSALLSNICQYISLWENKHVKRYLQLHLFWGIPVIQELVFPGRFLSLECETCLTVQKQKDNLFSHRKWKRRSSEDTLASQPSLRRLENQGATTGQTWTTLAASSYIRLRAPLPACSVCLSSFIALISEIKCFSCV